jgi:hypothetical protein
MSKYSVTALLPDQPPTIGIQAANDLANLHALAYRVSVETHQRQRESLLRPRPHAGSEAMPEIVFFKRPVRGYAS